MLPLALPAGRELQMTWQVTKIAIALALVLFLGLFWWLPDALVDPAMKLTGTRPDEPDYWVRNFSITAMGDNGTPRYILRAASLTHYPGNESTRLERPQLLQYDEHNTPIVTVADAGRVSPDGKKLVMTGNVKIIRGRDRGSVGGEVASNEITVTLN